MSNQTYVDNAIKSIKQAESWLDSIDLRSVPTGLRDVIKDGRADAKSLRKNLAKAGSR